MELETVDEGERVCSSDGLLVELSSSVTVCLLTERVLLPVLGNVIEFDGEGDMLEVDDAEYSPESVSDLETWGCD